MSATVTKYPSPDKYCPTCYPDKPADEQSTTERVWHAISTCEKCFDCHQPCEPCPEQIEKECGPCKWIAEAKAGVKDRHETFQILGALRYDVDRARQIVRDGREPYAVPEEFIRSSLQMCRIEGAHVLHVPADEPGIVASGFMGVQRKGKHGDWKTVKAESGFLIDGNHRAARAVKEGHPFTAYLLTPEESWAILHGIYDGAKLVAA